MTDPCKQGTRKIDPQISQIYTVFSDETTQLRMVLEQAN
jgi:hypothetical protein